MRTAVPLLLALSACAPSDHAFPSLLPRAIETRSDAEPVRPDPVATPDAALDGQVAALLDQLAAAERQFTAAVAEAEPRIRAGSGAAPGSERWLLAQTALAELDVARTDVQAPLAELERLAIDRAVAGAPPYPALDAALERARAVARTQADRIAALERLAA